MMPRIFGCKAPASLPGRVLGAYESFGLFEVSHHAHLSPRVDNQGETPSCVGHAFANAITILRSMLGLSRIEVSGESIWRKGCLFYNDSDYSSGLTLAQGLVSARELALLPRGSAMKRVPLTAESICSALQHGPLVVANTAHAGWENMRTDNHAVDESCSFEPGTNGHATCAFAVDLHNGRWMIRMENSWGGAGFVAMTIEHFIATALDNPILLYREQSHHDR